MHLISILRVPFLLTAVLREQDIEHRDKKRNDTLGKWESFMDTKKKVTKGGYQAEIKVKSGMRKNK